MLNKTLQTKHLIPMRQIKQIVTLFFLSDFPKTIIKLSVKMLNVFHVYDFLLETTYLRYSVKAIECTTFYKKEVHPVCCFIYSKKLLSLLAVKSVCKAKCKSVMYTKQTESIFLCVLL